MRRDTFLKSMAAMAVAGTLNIESDFDELSEEPVANPLRLTCYPFGSTARGRHGVRALDHFVNAAVFDGLAWESVSSHAWRERERPWARLVIWCPDRFQQDHCRRANKREQHVVDLVLQKGLEKQTIF